MARSRKSSRGDRGAAKAAKKRVWDDEKLTKLSTLYPSATWEEILKAFPKHSKNAIENAARRAGLTRSQAPKGTARAAGESPKKEREPVTEERIAAFMTSGRSVDEIARKFSLTREDAQKWVDGGFKEYELYVGPSNLRAEQTYVAVPKVGTAKVADRAWTFMRQKDGQPYGVIQFPDDFNHRKLKIIPLDSILFGHAEHDAERFDAVITKIAKSPNTFCFLNGDIIAHVESGKKDVKEQILLERSVEFVRKMRTIAHKVLWAQQGCLEAKSLRSQRFDPLQLFCERYGIPYFEEPVYIDLMWKGNVFTWWAMHGHSTAQVKGSKLNALRRPAQHHEFTHFIIMGHVNDSMWNRVPKIVREPATCRLLAMEEFHVILASFKKYFGTREAKRGYTPASNSDIICYVYPSGEHHVKTMSGGGVR